MNWGTYKHVNSSWALQLQVSAAMALVAVNWKHHCKHYYC